MRFSGKITARLMTALLAMAMLVSTFGTMVFAADVNVPIEGDASIVNGTKYQINSNHMTVTSTIEGTVNNVIDGNIETALTATGTKAMTVIDLGSKYTLSEIEITYGNNLVAENYSSSNAWYCNELYVSNYIPNAYTTGDTASAAAEMKNDTIDAKYVGNCDPSDKTTGNGVKNLTKNLGEYQYIILYNASRPLDIADVKMYSTTVKFTGATVGVSSGTNLKGVPVEGDASIKAGDLYEIDKANIKVTMPNTLLGQAAAAGNAFPYNVIDSDTTTTLTGTVKNDAIILDLGAKYKIDSVEVQYGSSYSSSNTCSNFLLWTSNFCPDTTATNATAILTELDAVADTSVCRNSYSINPTDINSGGQVATKSVAGDVKYRYVIIANEYRALDIAEITVYSTAKETTVTPSEPDDDEDDEEGVAKPGNVAYKAEVIKTNATKHATTNPAAHAVDGKADTYLHIDTVDSARYIVYDMGAEYPIEKLTVSYESEKLQKVKVVLSKEPPTDDNLADENSFNTWLSSEGVKVFNEGYDNFTAGTVTKTDPYGVADAPNARYITVLKYHSGYLYIKEIEAYKAAKATVGYSSGTNYKNAPLQGDVNLTVGNRYEINKANIKIIMPNSALGQKFANNEAFAYNVIDSDTTTALTGSVTNDMIILDLGKKYLIDSIDITYGDNLSNNTYANYGLWYANEIPEGVLNATPSGSADDPYHTAFATLQTEDVEKAVRLGSVGTDDGTGNWKVIDGKTVATTVSRSTKYQYVIILNQWRALDIAEITVYGKQEVSLTPVISGNAVTGTITGLSVADAKTCQLMAVSYDADGAATKISTMNLGVGMEDGTAYSEDYSLDVDEDATDIKLFIWRNDGTLTPVVMPTEIG